MKNLLLGLFLITTQVPAHAQDRWIIEREGDEVKMRPQFGSDFSKRYKGTIDDDGSIRLRNQQTGDVLRGNVDSDGYGYIRDSQGNRVRIRPR